MRTPTEECVHTFAKLSTSLASHNPLPSKAVEDRLQAIDLSRWTEKQLLKGTLSLTAEYRNRGHLGRLRAAILIGTTIFGFPFITRIERSQLFLAPENLSKKFAAFLTSLKAETNDSANPNWRFLSRRVDTYICFRRLAEEIAKSAPHVLHMLRVKPRHAIQKVLCLANLAFLHNYFQFEIGSSLKDWFDELGSPEDIASTASVLIALANDDSPLDSFDLAPRWVLSWRHLMYGDSWNMAKP